MTNREIDDVDIMQPAAHVRLDAESPGLVHHLQWNSYLSTKYKLLYVSTPKVACTTLKWWFASLEGYGQAIRLATDSNQSDPELSVHDLSLRVAPQVTGLELGELVEPLTSERYFRFAVVRNPYKRIFSAWQSKLLLREPLQIGPYVNSEFFHHPIDTAGDVAAAFEAFLEHLAVNETPSFWDLHWAPQFDILRPDLINYSVIGKIEQAPELSAAIIQWVGPYAPDPFAVRRANESLIPYQPEYVTARSVDLLSSLYAIDFDTFGYERALPASRETFSAEQMQVALQAIGLIRGRHHQLGQRSERIVSLSQSLSTRDAELAQLRQAYAAFAEREAALQATVAARDGECADLQRLCGAADAQIANLNLALEHHERDLSTLREALGEREAHAATLSEALSTMERAAAASEANVATLMQALAARDAALTVAADNLRQSDRQVGALQRDARDRDAELIQVSGLIEQRESEVAQLREQVAALGVGWDDRDREVANFNTAVAERDATIAHLTNEAAKRLIDKDNEIQVLQRKRIKLLGLTFSWRKKAAADEVSGIALRRRRERNFRSATRKIRVSSLFDSEFYRNTYPDLRDGNLDLATHYFIHGWREHRNPSALFNTAQYLAANPDVEAAGINPLEHYLKHGRREGRQLAPAPTALATSLVDGGNLNSTISEVEATPVHRVISEDELLSDMADIDASGMFDAQYYCSIYSELGLTPDQALRYYCEHGWQQGHNPSDEFNTSFYLETYHDIRNWGKNPFWHYVVGGYAEGRHVLPHQGRQLAPAPTALATSLVDGGNLNSTISEVEATPVHRVISEDELLSDMVDIDASGMFDAQYYCSIYSELGLTPDQALRYYCEHGWQQGHNPSDDFNTSFYLETYHDIRKWGKNPFWHYIAWGYTEGRHALPHQSTRYERDIRFGAIDSTVQLLALYTVPDWARVRAAKPMFKGHDIPLLPDDDLGYYEIGPEIMARQAIAAKRHGVSGFYFQLDAATSRKHAALDTILGHTEIDIAFCLQLDLSAAPSRVVNTYLAEALMDRRYVRVDGRPVVSVTLPQGSAAGVPPALEAILKTIKKARSPAPFVVGYVGDALRLVQLPAWLDAVIDLAPEQSAYEYAPFQPVDKSGVGTVPYSAVVAGGVARAEYCAGGDLPVYHSVVLARDNTSQVDAHHIVYTRFRKTEYRRWLDAATRSATTLHAADRRFIFINAWNDWTAGLFLEADKKGGYNRLNETARAHLGWDSDLYMPKVSVVVPNYNHEPYLRRRLDSIFWQDYPNIEVIILDDCSSDGSRAIIEEYAGNYTDFTRVIFNEKNSGGAFRQWARGIKAAVGELVWIAESDDFCDEKFLSTLVQYFADEAVMLAYGVSVFVDKDAVPMQLTDAAGSYLEDLELGDKWQHPYVATAHDEVRTALGIKNTIPNASGVVFRRPLDIPLLDDEVWLSMRVAGDWVFYLHLLRGGKIAFAPDAINYFRRYEGSTAEATYKKHTFYKEVGFASRTVAALYDVPWTVLERCRNGYLAAYNRMVARSPEEFDEWYDYGAVVSARESRLPNIMVTTMGFYPGGAEILPIRMANEFKRQGHSVLLLSSNLNPREDGVRRMLRNDVPVVETADVKETEAIIAAFGIEALNTHQWHIQKYPLARPQVFDRLKAHVASLHGMIEHGNAFAVTAEQLVAADQKVTTWVYTADKNLGPFIDLGLHTEGSPKFVKKPNGMQPPNIVPVRRVEIGIPEEAFVLCCVSRAIPDKGWAEAIDAVTMAREISGRDIRLILVGNGLVFDEYCRAGVPDFVHLAGFSENSVGYYAAADMGIMLSTFKSESFPLTIVDCLFAGKPYFATSIGEIRNILSDGDDVAGAVLDLKDWAVPIPAAAEIIAQFASNPEAYLAAKARVSTLAQRYRIDVVAAEYVELFAARRNSGRLGDTVGTN